MQTRTKNFVVALPLILWVLQSLTDLHAQQPAEAVRIASAVYLGDVPTIVAEERGLFADQGIQAEVTHHASGVLVEPRVSKLKARLNGDSQSRAVHFHVNNLYTGKWILVTSRRTAENRRALCRKLLAAYRETIDFIDRKPGEAIALFNRRMDVTDDILAEHWSALDYDLNIDWGLIASLQKQFYWARTVGYTNAGGPLRMLDLFDPGPLRDIQPSAVSIPEANAPDRTP